MTGEKDVHITEAKTRRDIKRFIDLQYRLYRGDKNFVPPLRLDIKGIVTGENNPLFKKGPFIRYIATRNGHTVGRIIAGTDEELNRKKGYRKGYITLFECEEDYTVAKALFDKAIEWLRQRDITYVRGPVSPTGGDDYRGLLFMGFDSPPALMNSYNPTWYNHFFERYGFTKDIDLCAFYYDLSDVAGAKRDRAVSYAMKRYGFSVEPVNFKNIEKEIRDIKAVLDVAMPDEWADLTPPSTDSIREFATTYKRLAEPELVYVARTVEGNPIGFSVALPNYNEVLIKIKDGRLFPFGIFKILFRKKYIKSARIFILFVIPEYRKRGVSGVIFYKSLRASIRMGYTWGDGSTIGDVNHNMIRDARGAGGKHYKTYRVYGMNV